MPLRECLHETWTNSSVSTFIHFFLCAYMRPAWQWTQTSLPSSRLLGWDKKFSCPSDFVPFSCKWQKISDRVQKFQACMLLGQRYIYLTKHVILSRNQAPSISSRFHVNGCKNFIPVWVDGRNVFPSAFGTENLTPMLPAVLLLNFIERMCRVCVSNSYIIRIN